MSHGSRRSIGGGRTDGTRADRGLRRGAWHGPRSGSRHPGQSTGLPGTSGSRARDLGGVRRPAGLRDSRGGVFRPRCGPRRSGRHRGSEALLALYGRRRPLGSGRTLAGLGRAAARNLWAANGEQRGGRFQPRALAARAADSPVRHGQTRYGRTGSQMDPGKSGPTRGAAPTRPAACSLFRAPTPPSSWW